MLRRNWSTFQVLQKGTFLVNSQQTNSTSTSAGTGGSSFASLLTGYYNQFQRNFSLVFPTYRAWELGWYVHDNWRVNNWLTLNLGLRYDITTPTSAKRNNISNFDPTDPATLAGGKVLVAGADGVSETLNIKTRLNQFQPRTGFAATLSKGLVLRGGFGMSFWPGAVFSPAKFWNAPFVSTVNLNQTAGAPTLSLDGSVPPPTPNPTCLVAACGARQEATYQ